MPDIIETFHEEGLQYSTGKYTDDVRDIKTTGKKTTTFGFEVSTCNSVYVTDGEWLLYSGTHYSQTCVQLPMGPAKFETADKIGKHKIGDNDGGPGYWTDQVSSLRPINQDNCLTVYPFPNFCGEQEERSQESDDPKLSVMSLVVRGKKAWKLYPTGKVQGGGYVWNNNQPLIVYPGKEHDIRNMRDIPGYGIDKVLEVVLAVPFDP